MTVFSCTRKATATCAKLWPSMTARIARRYLTWRRFPRCCLRFTMSSSDRKEVEHQLKTAQHLGNLRQVLGRLQLVFHFFTIRGRHGKTQAAPGDVPPPMRLAPRWQECPRGVAARQSIFQKIFFLRSIDTENGRNIPSRSFWLEPYLFERRRPRVGIDQHQPRLLNSWSNSARPDVFPDGPKHHAFVYKVLDLVQERFTLAAISLAVLLFEERVDVRIAPIGHGAATQYGFL